MLASAEHEPLPLLAPTGVLPALDATGHAALSFPVPNVGAHQALTLYAQAAFLAPSGVWLGAGTTLVLLGEGP